MVSSSVIKLRRSFVLRSLSKPTLKLEHEVSILNEFNLVEKNCQSLIKHHFPFSRDVVVPEYFMILLYDMLYVRSSKPVRASIPINNLKAPLRYVGAKHIGAGF